MIGDAAIQTVKIRHLTRRLAGTCVAVVAAVALGAATLHAATGGWSRVQHPALRGGGSAFYISDLLPPAGAANPWLAIGYLVDSDGNREPSAWTSPDAVAWTRTTMAPTTSSERRDGPFFVARRGSVAVALGDRFENELRPAAWFSSAPSTWTALTSSSDPLLGFDGRITALDAGPAEFVAVGVQYFAGQSRVTVFTSTDGQGWKIRSTLAPNEGMRPFGVSAASGRIVIVGDSAFGAGTDGRIWVLEDDGSWTRIEPGPLGLDGIGSQIVTSIAWNAGHGFVAGGSIMSSGHELPTLWTSPDGRTWTRLADGTPPTDVGNAAIQRLVAVGEGFLASGDSDAGPRVWRSNDGKSWTAIPPPPSSTSDRQFVIVASDAGKILLVARSDFGSQVLRRVGSTWTRADAGPAFPKSKAASELADVAAAGTRVIAIGQDGDERPLVMVSSAGGPWHRGAFPDRAGRLLAIAADRGTFWAAGWRLVHGRARMAVWTSKNGARWQRRGGTDFEPVGAFVDIAPVRNGLVAVALEPSRRGFVTTAWTLTRTGWRDEGVLGLGEPQATCAGPQGVTAVATVGRGVQSRVVAWTRTRSGRWPREPELVAGTGASAARCADAPSGTVIVGQDQNLAAVVWRRVRPGEPWRALVLAQTAPASSIGDVVRNGAGFLATGSFGGRGQADLAVWRSPDGIGWGWLGSFDPVFTEPGYQAGLGIVRAGKRIVVVGRHGAGNAGLWVGTDSEPTDEPGPH